MVSQYWDLAGGGDAEMGVFVADEGTEVMGWLALRRPGHTPLCCRSSGLRWLAPLSRCERGVCF